MYSGVSWNGQVDQHIKFFTLVSTTTQRRKVYSTLPTNYNNSIIENSTKAIKIDLKSNLNILIRYNKCSYNLNAYLNELETQIEL